MANSFICAYELNGDGSGTPVEESSLQSGAARAAPLWEHLSARSAVA